MFKIDVPDLPEREKTLERPKWIGNTLAPAGTKISVPAQPGRSRLVGVSSVYALNPCDRDTAISVLEQASSRDIKIVSLAESMQLPQQSEESDERDTDHDEEDEDDYEDVPA